jgi:hypothetical protein
MELVRHRWEVNIRMDIKEIRINTRNWIGSALDMHYRKVLVNVALNLGAPKPWRYLIQFELQLYLY